MVGRARPGNDRGPHKVSIIPRGAALGVTHVPPGRGPAHHDPDQQMRPLASR